MDELSVANGWEDGLLINEKKPREEWLRVRDWRKVVEDWKINWMLVDRGEKINGILMQADSGWALVHLDPGYAIWWKGTPENTPWTERYGIEPSLFKTEIGGSQRR